jgi:SAM-dependent methyltransferase
MSSNYFLLPRLTELTERLTSAEIVRQRIAECATGHVLELCARNRSNLFHFSRGITSLTTLVPQHASPALWSRQRLRNVPFPVDIRAGRCAAIPLKDQRFDCVVSTFALCAEPDFQQALREIKRVLKPTGRLLFAEYGLSREPIVAIWQQRLRWINRSINGASTPMTIIDDALAASGFALRSSICTYLPRVPRALGCVYEGIASNDG